MSEVEQTTIEAIKLNLDGVKKISKERILSELFKILCTNNFVKLNNNEHLKAIFLLIFPEKFGYVIQRLNTFFDPTKGDNFQTDKALAAIKQGGLTGQGMGEGILKESVPEAHTDYIIAVITEEFGSIISIIVITIFSLLLLYVL